jgi:hypothetical protein
MGKLIKLKGRVMKNDVRRAEIKNFLRNITCYNSIKNKRDETGI